MQRRTFRDQDPANIAAAELVGRLHDALDAAGYRGHDLERFLVRIVFCLFADDTGIFEPRDIFLDFIETRTSEDGSDTGSGLAELFQVLDTPEAERQKTLDEDLVRFPYVNGALFDGPLRIPSFDAAMRAALLDACRFDWSNISPAIFGALFQSVMDPKERRAKGAHYTTEKNILKVIEPLFLDDLRTEFGRLKARRSSRRRPDLLRFQDRLGKLRFFDPACGCGNFLIIAYRELRALEIEVLKEVYSSGQLDALAQRLSVIGIGRCGATSEAMRPSPRRTSMSSWKPRVTSTRSVSRPTRFFKQASLTCSRVPSVARPTMCAVSMPASAIRPPRGTGSAGWSPGLNGIPGNWFPGSASSSPT